MDADEIRARREARGSSDPLNRLRASNAARIAAGEQPIVEQTDPRADEGPCCTECSGPLDQEPRPGLCDACVVDVCDESGSGQFSLGTAGEGAQDSEDR